MITVSIDQPIAVVENGFNFIRFTVRLSQPPVNSLSMEFRTLLDGTALDSDLFANSASASNNGTVTFAPGEILQNIDIRLAGDSIDELDESFSLELFNLDAGASFAGGQPVLRATGIILDDDGAGSNLAFHVSNPVLVEGDSGSQMAVFEVRLSRPAGQAFSVSYATADGSATAGTDYTATSGVLNFAAGQEVAFVSVAVSGDMVGEITESFDLIVTPPGSPAIGTAGAVGTATIMDDDSGAGPVVSITGSTVEENQFNFIRFTVSLSEAPVNSVTMEYRTLLNGTALDADLFSNSASASNNGTVTFAPGETSQDVFIRVNGDALDEIDEAITLELFNLDAGASFAGGQPVLRATGIILDDDGAGSNLAFHVSNPVLVEGDSGSQMAVFEVRLSRPAGQAFSVSYATADGSATAGTDYTATSGVLNFAAGQEVAFVSVAVSGDMVGEITESFDLIVTPPGSPAIGTAGAVGTATIMDDDSGAGPVVSITGSTVEENQFNFIRFTVSLSEAPVNSVTMEYRTLLNGTALDADLFSNSASASNNGTVTFAPGETSQDLFIRVNGDALDEIDEAITLELFNLDAGASFAGGQPVLRATGIILDDDGAGSNLAFHVSNPVLVEGDSGSQMAVFEVRLSRPAGQAFSVSYATADGSATAGTDYTATSGVLNFAAGQEVAFVSVAVSGDMVGEITESFDLIVTPPGSPAIGTAGAVGTATIMDDDSGAGPVVSITGSTVEENQFNFIRFTVSLSEAPVNSVTMEYRTLLNGTALDSRSLRQFGERQQ